MLLMYHYYSFFILASITGITFVAIISNKAEAHFSSNILSRCSSLPNCSGELLHMHLGYSPGGDVDSGIVVAGIPAHVEGGFPKVACE